MIKPLSQKYALRWVCFLLFFLVSEISALGQIATGGTKLKSKNATNKTVNPPNKPAAINKVQIGEIDGVYAYDNLISVIYVQKDVFYYFPVRIPLLLSGKRPSKPVTIKLVLDDQTPYAAPEFSTDAGFATGINTIINITDFSSKGSDTTIYTKPITIRFNKIKNTGGHAYIEINNQKPGYDLNFYPGFRQGKPDIDSGQISENNVSDKRPAINLTDSLTSVQLDSTGSKLAQPIAINLSVKLSKGTWKDDSAKVTFTPLKETGGQAITILDEENHFTFKISKNDWNATKDTIIKKIIPAYVLQTKAITNDEGFKITLNLKGNKSEEIIMLKPYISKTKSKPTVINIVNPGDAEIESTNVGISHYYGSTLKSIDSIMVKVKVYGVYKKAQSVLAFAFIDTSLNKHFQIWPNPDTITKREWDAADLAYKTKMIQNGVNNTNGTVKKGSTQDSSDMIGELNIPLKIITSNLTDSLNNVPYIDLILKGQNHIAGGSQKIKLSIKDKPFWAEVGTNFDLLDNIKTSNFYAGVYMFDKNIGRVNPLNWFKNKNRQNYNNNLSFTGGVYESQAVSSASSNSTIFDYKDATSPVLNANGTPVTYLHNRDTGVINSTSSVKRIGLFVSPHLQLTKGKVDENGLHVFLSGYFEMLWQRLNVNFDYSKAKTVYSITDTGTVAINKFNNLPYQVQSLSYDYRSHYMGLGLPIYIKEKEFNLYINSVVGYTNQQFVITNDDVDAALYKPIVPTGYNNLVNIMQPQKGWNMFYLIQYRLNEVAYGLTFSGEIRSLFIPGSKPVITLALSKKFDLSALLKPLVAPF